MDTVSATVSKMAEQVQYLRDMEKVRQGREQEADRNMVERHEDRWQVWARALLPTGVLTAGWFTLWNILFGSPPPQ